jgi:hypothetical protein
MRPQPSRCPFARPVLSQFNRGKKTKAAKTPRLGTQTMTGKEVERAAESLLAGVAAIDDDWLWKELMKPRNYDEEIRKIKEKDAVTIDWFEQDLDAGTPRRLVRRGNDPEALKKEIEMNNMIVESETNPDYDNAELNRRMIDDLLEDPEFADLTKQLKTIKGDIRSKEELKEIALKEAKILIEDTITTLINDPAAAVAKADLQELSKKMPEVEDVDTVEFQDMLMKAMSKLNDDPTFQKALAAHAAAQPEVGKEDEDQQRSLEKELDVDPQTGEKTGEPIAPDNIEDLMFQMRRVMKSMGGDSTLEADLDAMLASEHDPITGADQEGIYKREMTPGEMAAEFTNLATKKDPKNGEAPKNGETPAPEDEEDVPAELQAKVDKILRDPKLMEKLTYITNLIEETAAAKADLTNIAHEVAPDPYELEDDRTTTLKERMQIAKQDPEHAAALENLRVDLLPPFNISPALKSFNQAIELAYIGANDDIRRILWRSYMKARTLPTFLQNMSDEAWDILYYSQAVTWGSNQNRTDHLRMLLKDLRSLGRNGPPTHPSTLVQGGDGEHLED